MTSSSRPSADRSRTTRAFVRASVLACTGARVGEIALLKPQDLRLNERAVLMPTEKRRRHAGRMERVISRRRIPLNDYGVAALAFSGHDLGTCHARPITGSTSARDRKSGTCAHRR
jgi:integrase